MPGRAIGIVGRAAGDAARVTAKVVDRSFAAGGCPAGYRMFGGIGARPTIDMICKFTMDG
jgi:hypothetical protein